MPEEEQNERCGIDRVLGGLTIHPLPGDWTPLEAFVLVKCLDNKGSSSWSYRTTHRLNREELLGALIVQANLLEKELIAEWEDE